MQEVPVFKPTFEEFKNFRSYLESIYNEFQPCGLAKIIPPKGFHKKKKLKI